jgi:hypothetical protein
MEAEARYLVNFMNQLIIEDDHETAWHLTEHIAKVYNNLSENSSWREEMRIAWEKMMVKWH